MVKADIRKSALLVEGSFVGPAFNLLRSDAELHNNMANDLAKFYTIRGDHIRIENNTNPLGEANIAYDLGPFNGVSKIFLDKVHIFLQDYHLREKIEISDLFKVSLKAVNKSILDNSYSTFEASISFHVALSDMSPAMYIGQFISFPLKGDPPVIGNAISYYFGENHSQTYSSVSLDMSQLFSDCVFVNVQMNYDATKITSDELSELIFEQFDQTLSFIGMDLHQ